MANLSEEQQHIADLEAKVKALETEASGGRDLNALAKAERDFHSFDINVIQFLSNCRQNRRRTLKMP